MYEDYNKILKYLEENSDYVICPYCRNRVSTQLLLSLEEYKFIGPGYSRQAIGKKLNKMAELGGFDKINLRREMFRIKKYWHPKIQERIRKKVKKRR